MQGLNKKLIWSILFGLITIIAMTFIADVKDTVYALKEFQIKYLPLILGLTFINYILRFVKWHYFLNLIHVKISIKDSFAVFLSGLAMSVTPGKVGELLKSVLIKEMKGVPIGRTAPVIFAERLSDGFGLIILSLSGIMLFKHGTEILAIITGIMLVLLLILKNPAMHKKGLAVCGKIPFVNRFVGFIETMIESVGQLLTFRSLIFTIVLSIISWSFECVAFYYVFVGLGFQIPFLLAVFTLAFSSVVGAASMLPGGLGAAEGSIMGLLVKIGGVPKDVSAVATMIIRFCTLWFGVILGFIALGSKRKLIRMFNSSVSPEKEGAPK